MGRNNTSRKICWAVGKDEVPGPNPGSSSMKKFLIYVLSAKIRGFFVSKSSEFQKSKVS